MDLRLTNKKALIAGGTRGIGLAIATELAQEGCHVSICARCSSEVKHTVESLCGMGIRCMGKAIDVGNNNAVKCWVEETAIELGGLDR